MEDKELKEAIAGIMKDKRQRDALAELLVEFIDPTHVTLDFMNALIDARSIKKGDSLIKKIRKGIVVHTFVPGAIPLKSEVTVTERMNWVLDGAQVGLVASEWDLESGDIGTVQSLRAEALLKLRDFYLNKVFSALSTIWTSVNTSSNYTALNGHLTSTALENAIDYINATTSGAKAIVGVRSLLTPITKFGAFWNDGVNTTVPGKIDSQLQQVVDNGFLGKFYGVPIVALNQVWDNPEDRNALLPTDKVIVIGEKVGEFITYGPVKEKQYTDMEPTPPMWNWDAYQEYGMIIDNASGIYLLDKVN
jgi:hypothetical protein